MDGPGILNSLNDTPKMQTMLSGVPTHLLGASDLLEAHLINNRCPALATSDTRPSLSAVCPKDILTFILCMRKQRFHQMSKVTKSLMVKLATKPRTDPFPSADEKESAHEI